MKDGKISKLLIVATFATLLALFLVLFDVKSILLGELIFALVMALVAVVMFAKLMNSQRVHSLALLFYIANLVNVIVLYFFAVTYWIILLLVLIIVGFFLAIESCVPAKCCKGSKKKLNKSGDYSGNDIEDAEIKKLLEEEIKASEKLEVFDVKQEKMVANSSKKSKKSKKKSAKKKVKKKAKKKKTKK